MRATYILATVPGDPAKTNVINVNLRSSNSLMKTYCAMPLPALTKEIKTYPKDTMDQTAVAYGLHIGTVEDLAGNDVNDLSAIVHQYTCSKRYEHSGDPEVKTGFDCPLCHPETYRTVERNRLGKKQALVKPGSTKSSVKVRYQEFVELFATYKHRFVSDLFFQYMVEAYYFKKILAKFGFTWKQDKIHTESWIIDEVEDSVFADFVEEIATELTALGVEYVAYILKIVFSFSG